MTISLKPYICALLFGDQPAQQLYSFACIAPTREAAAAIASSMVVQTLKIELPLRGIHLMEIEDHFLTDALSVIRGGDLSERVVMLRPVETTPPQTDQAPPEQAS